MSMLQRIRLLPMLVLVAAADVAATYRHFADAADGGHGIGARIADRDLDVRLFAGADARDMLAGDPRLHGRRVIRPGPLSLATLARHTAGGRTRRRVPFRLPHRQ